MSLIRTAGILTATVITLLSIFFVPQLRAEADWKLFYKAADETREYYFDKASIVRPEPKVVKVWQKVVEVNPIKETRNDLWKAQVEIICSTRKYVVLADQPTEPELKKAAESPFLTSKKLEKDPSLEGNILWALMENVCP